MKKSLFVQFFFYLVIDVFKMNWINWKENWTSKRATNMVFDIDDATDVNVCLSDEKITTCLKNGLQACTLVNVVAADLVFFVFHRFQPHRRFCCLFLSLIRCSFLSCIHVLSTQSYSICPCIFHSLCIQTIRGAHVFVYRNVKTLEIQCAVVCCTTFIHQFKLVSFFPLFAYCYANAHSRSVGRSVGWSLSLSFSF